MIEVDVAFAVAGFEVLALLNDDPSGNTNDGRVRWNGFEDDGAGPDFCAFTDGKRTEDFGPAGDDDVVADGRMAFSFFFTGTAEGYALIEDTLLPMIVVSPMTIPMPWSIKSPSPI